MPNIASVLKDEIRRLAKKEIKAQVGTTKQAVVNLLHWLPFVALESVRR